MANVLLTTRCNLRCPYCFAQEKLSDGQKLTMSMADVEKVIAFLKRSNHPFFRAMGGEPTLHPEFPRILKMALESGLRVDLLSNATWPESYNDLFQRTSPRRLVFLLNVDHPDRYAPHIWERIERNLAAISGRGSVTLSFNIFEKQPRYEYILELTRKYGIDKIRMSFSLPVVGANNACLKLQDYRQMAPFVVEFARRAEEGGVQVRMDNAVPLCMFSYEQAGELLMKGVVDLQRNMRCAPVIDIGPDLSVWCCFCLSKMWNRHLDEFQNLEEIHAYYRRAMSLYQSRLYPMEECNECSYRELWNCQGGCLTHTVMKHGELSLDDRPGETTGDGFKEDAVLALSPDVEIRRYDMPEASCAIFNKVSGVELEMDGSFQPLLLSLNGQFSAREVVDQYIGDNAPNAESASELATLTQGALRQGASELLLGMLHQGLVVERHV
ncbi:MAG: radical SAM protein [Terracidiphilus sp.]|jgi:radical SAM protein with 4Fe4S-binding SPASM domain